MTVGQWKETWASLSLASRFLVVSAFVLLAGMSAVGHWIATRISDGVTHHIGAATALYVDSLISPHLQELASRDRLSARTQASIGRILSDTPLGKRIQTIKVWKKGGLIAFSSREAIIGQTFAPTSGLKAAWQGTVSADFDRFAEDEDAFEKASGAPLLEMYVPVRSRDEDRIIAVAEFYMRAEDVEREIASAVTQSWAVVGAATLAMLLALWASMRHASRTIEAQRDALERQIAQLTEVLEQNRLLRDRVQSAYLRTARLNERFLRRVGADLHDGPAQLIGLALLRLDTLRGAGKEGNSDAAEAEGQSLERLRGVLGEALREIRNLSAGLAVPELGQANPDEAIRLAVQSHQSRTGTHVLCDLDRLPGAVPDEVTVCLYRFVQEGLNNAFRHARAAKTIVRARGDGERIEVEIVDDGPGFGADTLQEDAGMGLVALRDRVEALGGWFDVRSAPGDGVRLSVRFNQRTIEQLRAEA